MKAGTKFAWAALGMVGVSVGLWSWRTIQVAIPEDRTLFVVAFLSAAALGITAFVRGVSWLGGLVAAAAIFVGLLVPFTVAVSRQEVATDAIRVGDTIPHFAAVDEHGEAFDSLDLHGHLLLIKFFRAHW